MTPVILLSDGYLANGGGAVAHPVQVDKLPDISVTFASQPNVGEDFWPFLRDDETLARPWAIPGTQGLEHRIGGLEKADGTGNISYDPDNHQLMTLLRQAKIKAIEEDIEPLEWQEDEGAEILLLGWGSTYGAIGAAVQASAQARWQDRSRSPQASESVPQEHRGSAAALRQDRRARDEHGPTLEAGAAGVPHRRDLDQPGDGPAVPRGRPRRRGHKDPVLKSIGDNDG